MIRVLTISLVLAAAATALAATPRLQALGGDGAYLEDAGNVLRWTGSLADHTNRFILASGTFDGHGYPGGGNKLSGPWAGAQFGLGGDDKPFAGALYALSHAADQGSGNVVDLQSGGYQVLVGMNDPRQGAFTLGWRHTGAADGRAGEQRQELSMGLRAIIDATSYLDLGLELTRTDRRQAGTGTNPGLVEPATGFAGRARVFAGLSETLVLVLVTSVDGDDRNWDGDPSWPDRTYRAGTALTWLPDPDRLVLFSTEYRHFGVPHDWSSQALLIRMAAENRLNAFLSLRAAVGWEEREDPDESLAPVSMGLAVHAWDWDLDLALATSPPLDTAGRRPAWGDAALGWLSAALSRSF